MPSFGQGNIANGNNTKNFLFSGFSNTILNSLAPTSANFDSATVDNTPDLYTQRDNGTVNPKAFRYSGFSLTVKSSLTRTSAAGTRGITIDKNSNFYDANGATQIRKYSGFTNTVLSSFTDGRAGVNIWDITIDNTGDMMSNDFGNIKEIKYSGFSATVKSSFSNVGSGSAPRGTTWDGTNTIVSINTPTRYLKFSGFTSTIKTSTGTFAAQPHGSEWDKFRDRFPLAVAGFTSFSKRGLMGLGY